MGPRRLYQSWKGVASTVRFVWCPILEARKSVAPLTVSLLKSLGWRKQGVKEVNLLGQNVNAYQGKMHDGSVIDLGGLIHYVAAVDGIERIRFTTSHPVEFSASLVEAYANVPQLANYLHLPVQSGSDRVLSLMKTRSHHIGIQTQDSKIARSKTQYFNILRLYRGFSRRDPVGLRCHHEVNQRCGF